MSKKTNIKEMPEKKAQEAVQVEKKEVRQQEAPKKPCVYCGPSVRGVVRQYTVFTGEVPELLKNFIKEHPAANALIVPTERVAEMRAKLETVGTAEAILYKQIKSEL